MKTPKEMWRTLFRAERPLIRKLAIKQGEGFTKDIGVLWAAYKAGSFADLPEGMNEADFLTAIEALQKEKTVWLIDDFNPAYKDKRGPVAMACTSSADLIVSVEGCAFKWATKRNLLRCAASFLHLIRQSRATGVCMVKCNKAGETLMKHLMKYKVLYFMGCAAKDSYLYSARGKAVG